MSTTYVMNTEGTSGIEKQTNKKVEVEGQKDYRKPYK